MTPKILLVEDEAGLVMTLSDRLRSEGYAVESAPDGDSGLAQALVGTADLVILDVMLPRRSGFDVCRTLRQRGFASPILMLTARDQVVDKVVGLQMGADDYLSKPFEVIELLARIEALLRRVNNPCGVASAPGGRAPEPPACLRLGAVTVDLRRAEVRRGDQRVALPAREFALLRYLVAHRGDILSREELLDRVWGYAPGTSTRTVDVHIAWLRQKIEDNPRVPSLIETVRGFGYRLTG